MKINHHLFFSILVVKSPRTEQEERRSASKRARESEGVGKRRNWEERTQTNKSDREQREPAVKNKRAERKQIRKDEAFEKAR